jgi:hypothetical protein
VYLYITFSICITLGTERKNYQVFFVIKLETILTLGTFVLVGQNRSKILLARVQKNPKFPNRHTQPYPHAQPHPACSCTHNPILTKAASRSRSRSCLMPLPLRATTASRPVRVARSMNCNHRGIKQSLFFM